MAFSSPGPTVELPTPRRWLVAKPPFWTTSPGTTADRSCRFVTPLLTRLAPVTAVTETGTFCRFSARRLAVTITVSTVAGPAWPADAGGAWDGVELTPTEGWVGGGDCSGVPAWSAGADPCCA